MNCKISLLQYKRITTVIKSEYLNRKGGGEELGGIEGEKTLIKIYWMRKKSNFNKREEQTNR